MLIQKNEVFFAACTLIKQELWRNRCNVLYDGVRRSSRNMDINIQYRMHDLYEYGYRILNFKRRNGACGDISTQKGTDEDGPILRRRIKKKRDISIRILDCQ